MLEARVDFKLHAMMGTFGWNITAPNIQALATAIAYHVTEQDPWLVRIDPIGGDWSETDKTELTHWMRLCMCAATGANLAKLVYTGPHIFYEGYDERLDRIVLIYEQYVI